MSAQTPVLSLSLLRLHPTHTQTLNPYETFCIRSFNALPRLCSCACKQVALGFAHVAEKDVFVCKLKPEELQPLVLVLKGQFLAEEAAAKGGQGRSFVTSQVSADHGFKSFPEGLPGLKQRWGELEMCLREGWDDALQVGKRQEQGTSSVSKVLALGARFESAAQFFSSIDEVATEADVLRGVRFSVN